MAKTKDFSTMKTDPVYSTLAQATAETQEPQGAQEAQEAQEKKTRRTYNPQEAADFMQTRSTTGRKGLKLPRINLAFSPELHDYIKVMARVRGESMTDFVNYILQQHMEENAELYEKAQEFKNAL